LTLGIREPERYIISPAMQLQSALTSAPGRIEPAHREIARVLMTVWQLVGNE
jgi:hypothetical protein